MEIKVGSTEVFQVFAGSTTVTEIFLGSTSIWQPNPDTAFNLPSGPGLPGGTPSGETQGWAEGWDPYKVMSGTSIDEQDRTFGFQYYLGAAFYEEDANYLEMVVYGYGVRPETDFITNVKWNDGVFMGAPDNASNTWTDGLLQARLYRWNFSGADTDKVPDPFSLSVYHADTLPRIDYSPNAWTTTAAGKVGNPMRWVILDGDEGDIFKTTFLELRLLAADIGQDEPNVITEHIINSDFNALDSSKTYRWWINVDNVINPLQRLVARTNGSELATNIPAGGMFTTGLFYIEFIPNPLGTIIELETAYGGLGAGDSTFQIDTTYFTLVS